MAQGFFNPFQRNDYLSPSVATLHSTTYTGGTHDAVFGSCVYDAINDDAYFAERGRQLFHLDGLDDTQFQMDHDLGSTGTPVYMDLELYQVNGVRKLFFVYEKSGNLCIGISTLPVFPAGTVDNNWLTSTVSGAFTNTTASNYNFMRVADNGFAYIFADNTVHKIDGTTTGGTNGTVYPNVLLFPPFFRITDGLDYRGLMFIAVQQTIFDQTTAAANGNQFNTPCGVYLWDRQTTVVNTRDYIPLIGVKAIKKIYVGSNGAVRIICIMSSGLVKILEYSGSNFTPIRELGLGAAPQYPDSLDFNDQLTIWLGTDGNIYGHGIREPGGTEILAKLGYVKAPTSSDPSTNVTGGALLFGASNSFSGTTGYRTSRQGITVDAVISGTPTSYKFFPFDIGTINSNAQTALTGDAYTQVFMLPELCKINYVRVYHAVGTTDGTSVQGTLKTFLNQSATASRTDNITRTDIVQGWKYIPVTQGAKDAVFAIQFAVNWTTGVTLSDAYDWLPRMIEVDYEPVVKKK